MWRRGPFWAAALLVSLGISGCSAGRGRAPATASSSDQGSSALGGQEQPSGSLPPAQLQHELAQTKQRIEQLEQQIQGQESDLTQAREEANELRTRELTARSELQQLQAQVEKNRAPYVAMAASSGGSWDAYQERTGQGGGGSPLIATLRQKLIDEREQRVRLERQLERLQSEAAEMSAGPFENKLQSDLTDARKQVEDLKQALSAERQARQDLAQHFEQLQLELERVRQEHPAAAAAAPSEEIAALEARQKRVLASIERDLLLSRQRESEMRAALEASQGPDAAPLAAAVSNLRSENEALQTRLDDEHRHNLELSAKLNLAARVTDLIFKMRNADSRDPLPTP
jgi:DNA repair exonuclease SbcCD ATPase subunit